MATNLDDVKKQLAGLISLGNMIKLDLWEGCRRDSGKKASEHFPKEAEGAFHKEYQRWYSEAKSVVRQLLPDREKEFIKLYEGDPKRKDMDASSYPISEYIIGVQVSDGFSRKPLFDHRNVVLEKASLQQAILEACKSRFESKLFDIVNIARGDLHASELDAARELLKNKYERAAGIVAGVVLEGHLKQVAANHNVKITKKGDTLSPLNDALKTDSVYDLVMWRFIQRLADIRNLCGHRRERDPTPEEVRELIDGTDKVTKTVL